MSTDLEEISQRLARLEGSQRLGVPPSPPPPDPGSWTGQLAAALERRRLERVAATKAEKERLAAEKAQADALAAAETARIWKLNEPRRLAAQADLAVLERRLEVVEGEREQLLVEIRDLREETSS